MPRAERSPRTQLSCGGMAQRTSNCSCPKQYENLFLTAPRSDLANFLLLQRIPPNSFRLLPSHMEFQLPLVQVLLHCKRQKLDVLKNAEGVEANEYEFTSRSE